MRWSQKEIRFANNKSKTSFKSQGHEDAYKEFLALDFDSPSTPIKHKIEPINNQPLLTESFSAFKRTKYPVNSEIQKYKFKQLSNMIIKCMLPVSIVENENFTEWLEKTDPSFNIPDYKTFKEKGKNYIAYNFM